MDKKCANCGILIPLKTPSGIKRSRMSYAKMTYCSAECRIKSDPIKRMKLSGNSISEKLKQRFLDIDYKLEKQWSNSDQDDYF